MSILYHLLVELRPKQWIKNLACLAGLIFSGQLFDAWALRQAVLAVLAFCCASSAVYVVNDLVDLNKDRENSRAARRPLAAGNLPVWIAAVAAVLLGMGAVAIAGWLNVNCLTVVILYVVLTTLYTLWLKHVVIADVMCIAIGFVLRVVFGVYAVQVQPTAWIAGCMVFLALFLGFGKRKAERDRADADPARIRPVLADYGRESLAVLLAMSGAMTIIAYSLFTVASHRNPTLIITVVPVAYCVMRYLMQVMLHGRGESPESIVLSDVPLWIGIVTWIGLCVLILYGDLHLFVEPT